MSGRIALFNQLHEYLHAPKFIAAKQIFSSVFLGVWLVFLTLFFLMRFTFSFYYENAQAIKTLFGAS